MFQVFVFFSSTSFFMKPNFFFDVGSVRFYHWNLFSILPPSQFVYHIISTRIVEDIFWLTGESLYEAHETENLVNLQKKKFLHFVYTSSKIAKRHSPTS